MAIKLCKLPSLTIDESVKAYFGLVDFFKLSCALDCESAGGVDNHHDLTSTMVTMKR